MAVPTAGASSPAGAPPARRGAPLDDLAIGRITSLGTADALPAVEVTGMITLAFLSALASRQAGFRGAWLALGAIAGGLIGLTVIALQIVLKPH